MTKFNELENEKIGTLLLNYSIPAILGLLVNVLYMIVDRIFVSNIPDVGLLNLTAIGQTAPITTLILAISALIGFGIGTNVSIFLGKQQVKNAEMAIGNAISYSVIIYVVLVPLFFLSHKQIFEILGIVGETKEFASAYIDIIVMGILFNILSFIFPILIRADGSPKFAASLTIIACVLNIILDAIAIFIFNMGILGAALSTVISQLLSSLIGFLYFFKFHSNLKLKRDSFIPDTKILKSMIIIGLIPFANQLSFSIAQLIGNYSLLLYGGELSIGAMTVIRSIVQLFMIIVFGIGQGFQPIVGYNFAKKNYARSFDILKLSILWSLIVLIIGELIIHIYTKQIILLFIKDENISNMAVHGIRKYTLFLPFEAIIAITASFMMVTKRIKSSLILNISYQLLLSASIIYTLPLLIGFNGLWYSQPMIDIFASVIASMLFIKEYKELLHNKIIKLPM